jgi:hypothetical protein
MTQVQKHRTFHNSDNFNESSTLLNVELRGQVAELMEKHEVKNLVTRVLKVKRIIWA